MLNIQHGHQWENAIWLETQSETVLQCCCSSQVEVHTWRFFFLDFPLASVVKIWRDRQWTQHNFRGFFYTWSHFRNSRMYIVVILASCREFDLGWVSSWHLGTRHRDYSACAWSLLYLSWAIRHMHAASLSRKLRTRIVELARVWSRRLIPSIRSDKYTWVPSLWTWTRCQCKGNEAVWGNVTNGLGAPGANLAQASSPQSHMSF